MKQEEASSTIPACHFRSRNNNEIAIKFKTNGSIKGIAATIIAKKKRSKPVLDFLSDDDNFPEGPPW